MSQEESKLASLVTDLQTPNTNAGLLKDIEKILRQ